MAGRSGSPDPFGKRALFWTPIGPDSDERPNRRQAAAPGPGRLVTGKRALYSQTANGRGSSEATGTSAASRVPADGGEVVGAGLQAGDHPGRGNFAVACSACRSTTAVGILELVALHLPVGAFIPRRAFDHWMRCPACHRRTWAGVSLAR